MIAASRQRMKVASAGRRNSGTPGITAYIAWKAGAWAAPNGLGACRPFVPRSGCVDIQHNVALHALGFGRDADTRPFRSGLDTRMQRVKRQARGAPHDVAVVEVHPRQGEIARDVAVRVAGRARLERCRPGPPERRAHAGRHADAVRHFQAAVDKNPSFGTGWLYLAKAHLDAGDLKAAEQEALRGLDAAPGPSIRPLGHYVLADGLNRQGRPAEAAEELRRGKAAEARRTGPAR